MARFPFGLPYNYPYYKYYNNYYNTCKNESSKVTEDKKESDVQVSENQKEHKKISSKNNNFLPFSLNINGFSNSEQPIIELFGIKLYLDDIIILCLLFILYKEDVKDEMLFICLILLLLS
jgi:hypothetical protein